LKNKRDRRKSQLEDDFVKEDLEQMTRAVNYLEYQYRMIKPHLGKRIMEIGSGIGTFTARLLRIAEIVVSIEPNKYCFGKLQDDLGCNKSLVLVNKKIEECHCPELQSYLPDTIICLNVLEHIEDDSATIENFYRILKPGGKLLLVVPSPDWAFGVIDRAVGHFRRYSRNQLSSLVKKNGFREVYTRYYNPIGLVGWLWNGKVAGIVKQSDRQIYIFDRLVIPLQSFIEKWIKFPLGQSLLLVAVKDDQIE